MPQFPMRVKLFAFCDLNIKRFLNIIIAVHQGFWLGILSQKQIDQATELNYLSLEKYRNLNYNKSGLWDWEEKALKSHFQKCKSILVGACGGGREILALSAMGFQVDGFECVDKLVQHSKEALKSEGINSQVYLSSPNQAPSELGKYDGLILGWGAYMHIRGRDKRVDFLKEFRLHINDNGPILLSFFARDNSKQYGSIYKVARFFRFLTRNSDSLEIGDTLNGTFDHFFTKEEVESELTQAGFEMVYYSADITYPHAIAKAI